MQRFWSKVTRTDDCWLWSAGVNKGGYGSFWLEGRPQSAHRVAMELLGFALDPNLELDHLCRNTRCVRPEHLEEVTHKVNALRGEGIGAKNARKTHCPRGHLLVESNVYLNGRGGKQCKVCHRINGTNWAKNNPERRKEISRESAARRRKVKLGN